MERCKGAAATVVSGGEACADAAAATGGGDGGERPRMVRMPQEYVDWVLAQKREAYYDSTEDYHTVRTNNPIEVPGLSPDWVEKTRKSVPKTATLLKELDDSFEEFQEHVRRDVEEYEVGVDYFVRRAEFQALIDERWAKIDFTGLDIEDEDDDRDCLEDSSVLNSN